MKVHFFATLVSTVAAAAITLSSSMAWAGDDTISKVKSAGELRACIADDNPYAIKNPASGQWEGLIPDMAAKLAETLGVKLVQVDANWDAILQPLLADQCDVLAASLFATVKRSEQVLFSDPFAAEYTTAFVRTDSPYKTYADLDVAGKVIAVRAGAAPGETAKQLFKKATVKSYLGENTLPILTDLSTGRIDGFVDGQISTSRFLAQNPQYSIKPIGAEPLNPVEVVWAMKPGDYQFQQLVNTFLFTFRASGDMAAGWKKWFGSTYEVPRL